MKVFATALVALLTMASACVAQEDSESTILPVIVGDSAGEFLAGTYNADTALIRLTDDAVMALQDWELSLMSRDGTSTLPLQSAGIQVDAMSIGEGLRLVNAAGDVVAYLMIEDTSWLEDKAGNNHTYSGNNNIVGGFRLRLIDSFYFDVNTEVTRNVILENNKVYKMTIRGNHSDDNQLSSYYCGSPDAIIYSNGYSGVARADAFHHYAAAAASSYCDSLPTQNYPSDIVLDLDGSTTGGQLLNSIAPAPAYSPNHEYTIYITGRGDIYGIYLRYWDEGVHDNGDWYDFNTRPGKYRIVIESLDPLPNCIAEICS